MSGFSRCSSVRIGLFVLMAMLCAAGVARCESAADTSRVSVYAIEICRQADSHVLLISTSQGLLRSENEGETWTECGIPESMRGTHVWLFSPLWTADCTIRAVGVFNADDYEPFVNLSVDFQHPGNNPQFRYFVSDDGGRVWREEAIKGLMDMIVAPKKGNLTFGNQRCELSPLVRPVQIWSDPAKPDHCTMHIRPVSNLVQNRDGSSVTYTYGSVLEKAATIRYVVPEEASALAVPHKPIVPDWVAIRARTGTILKIVTDLDSKGFFKDYMPGRPADWVEPKVCGEWFANNVVDTRNKDNRFKLYGMDRDNRRDEFWWLATNIGLLATQSDGKKLAFCNTVPVGTAEQRDTYYSVTVHPANNKIVYTGPKNRGLWRSTDGGTKWEQVAIKTFPSIAKVRIPGLSGPIQAGMDFNAVLSVLPPFPERATPPSLVTVSDTSTALSVTDYTVKSALATLYGARNPYDWNWLFVHGKLAMIEMRMSRERQSPRESVNDRLIDDWFNLLATTFPAPTRSNAIGDNGDVYAVERWHARGLVWSKEVPKYIGNYTVYRIEFPTEPAESSSKDGIAFQPPSAPAEELQIPRFKHPLHSGSNIESVRKALPSDVSFHASKTGKDPSNLVMVSDGPDNAYQFTWEFTSDKLVKVSFSFSLGVPDEIYHVYNDWLLAQSAGVPASAHHHSKKSDATYDIKSDRWTDQGLTWTKETYIARESGEGSVVYHIEFTSNAGNLK